MNNPVRYYPRYFGKQDGFLELYEVADSRTGEALSNPIPYHDALDQADRRNNPESEETAVPALMHGWLGGLKTTP